VGGKRKAGHIMGWPVVKAEGPEALTQFLVIPGLAKREPGIHRATERAVKWIPGSRFAIDDGTRYASAFCLFFHLMELTSNDCD
jgi:hypothetical protein